MGNKIIVKIERVYCPDGVEFNGASCLGKDLPEELGLPEENDYLKYHVRVSGADVNSLEPGTEYEVEYYDIKIDDRPQFEHKRMVRVFPVGIKKI